MSRGRRFARNVGWTVAGQIGIMAINLAAVPMVIRALGREAYGVYVLMYTVGSYLALFQLGAGVATIKFVAEAKAAGEDRALREAVAHSAAIHFGGVGAAAAVLWALSGWLARSVFKVPEYYQWHALWLFRAAAAGGVLAAGVQWTSACFQGLQRFGWPAALSLLQALLIPAGLIAALATGHGLGAAAAWFVAANGLTFAAGALALRRALPRGEGGTTGFGDVLRYGLSFMPAFLGDTASNQLDRAFVAGLRGVGELALYSVPAGLLQRFQVVPSAISSALIPVIVESARFEDRETMTRLYLRATRALLAVGAWALGLMFALIPQFLGLWLGRDFSAAAAGPARLLVCAQACAVIAFAPGALAGGLGGGRLSSTVAWSQIAGSLLLWPLLIPRFGLSGAAAGSLAVEAATAWWYLHEAHRRFLGLGWGRFLREAAGPVAAPAAALLLCAWLGRAVAWSWPGLFAAGAAASAVYAALAWRTLPREDVAQIRAWVSDIA